MELFVGRCRKKDVRVMTVRVYCASSSDLNAAYGIVQEYYRAATVVVRESAEEFAKHYFTSGAGVWLAEIDHQLVGCVALRPLKESMHCGEVKRLYVRPAYRGQGIADLLLEALESYAKEFGYEWLYLDTAADMKAAARFYERRGFCPESDITTIRKPPSS